MKLKTSICLRKKIQIELTDLRMVLRLVEDELLFYNKKIKMKLTDLLVILRLVEEELLFYKNKN